MSQGSNPLEKSIEKGIRTAIKQRGGKVYKMHGSQYSLLGAPDLIGCLYNVPFAIEVKRPGGKATPKQQHELDEWAQVGWATGVAHSEEEALQIIGEGPMRLQLTDAQRTRDVKKLGLGLGLQVAKDGTIINGHAVVCAAGLCECGREYEDCSTRDNPEGGHHDR